MVDTETGIIYMEVPDANEGRSLKAIGTAIAGGVASLATGAAVNSLLGNKCALNRCISHDRVLISN